MKAFAALSFAAILGLAVVPAAQAAPLSDTLAAEESGYRVEYDHVDQAENPYHRCHGMASGTAHHSCGSPTGGPSGGLF